MTITLPVRVPAPTPEQVCGYLRRTGWTEHGASRHWAPFARDRAANSGRDVLDVPLIDNGYLAVDMATTIRDLAMAEGMEPVAMAALLCREGE